ncbi:MAG: alpha/beta hydrolase family protein [Thermoanaerobaculia bacterium]
MQHPDLFADSLRAANTGYWEEGRGDMEGSIWERHERYLENSPLFYFPEIDRPLLIGQGNQDGGLVPTDAIFAARERLGKSVEVRFYRAECQVTIPGRQRPRLLAPPPRVPRPAPRARRRRRGLRARDGKPLMKLWNRAATPR